MALQNIGSINSTAVLWLPYCGPGATPSDFISRWNVDPWLLAGLAATAAGASALNRSRPGKPELLLGALMLLVVSFVSPLCALSSALFSARVVHHALLVLGVAPLIAFGLREVRGQFSLPAATLLHTVVLWTWHAPTAYGWALSSDGAYWLMQATLGMSALIFWLAVRNAGGLAAAAGLLAGMVQMGALGALVSLAPRPLYAPHLMTTQPWGMSPLTDQQLGGLIMWAPMAGVYLLAALVLVGRSLEPNRRLASA
jgi:putative membrane protein